MPIVVTHENIPAERLRINDDGSIALNGGVPTAQLTVNGIAMCDGSGQVINGRVVDLTVAPGYGTYFVTSTYPNQAQTVTLPFSDRIPIVYYSCSEVEWTTDAFEDENNNWVINFNQPSTDPPYYPAVHVDAFAGGFTLVCGDFVNAGLHDQTGYEYSHSGQYVWL